MTMYGEWSDPLTERHVQALWFDASKRPPVLRTTRGNVLRVIDPGVWNLEAGPDFRGAVLEVDGVRLVGDVEIHLRPSDWYAHGHGKDSAYRDVVAHVTWFTGPPPREGKGGLPPGCVSVCLGDAFRSRPDFSPYEVDVTAYPFAAVGGEERPCRPVVATRDVAVTLTCVRRAGVLRLMRKAARLSALFVRRGSHTRVFYEESLAAFGYRDFAVLFRALAQRMPWENLPHDAEAACAALTAAAGLDGTLRPGPGVRRGRPANAPEKRLAGAAALFCGGVPLLERLADCDWTSPRGVRTARDILCVSHALGPRRAAALLANVVVPFFLAEGVLDRPPDWLCAEDISSPVRIMARRLFGVDHSPSLYAGDGILVQGLIQIYRDYCLSARNGCDGCSFAGLLRKCENEEGGAI